MANIFDMIDTWDDGGITFTAIKMDVTDTASAAASLLMNLQVGGVSKFSVDKNGSISAIGGSNASFTVGGTGNSYARLYGGSSPLLILGSAGSVAWRSASTVDAGSNDLILARDAANILAQRNGVNAQALRVYNTYTDSSNYERGEISWVSNNLQIGTAQAGTGTVRNIQFYRGGTLYQTFSSGGVLFSQNVLWAADNANDIGASGANRPRNIYAANSIESAGPFVAAASGQYNWAGRSRLFSPANGNIELTNSAVTDFGLLQFGGTTASFPALKRNAAILETKLADDSAYAQHNVLISSVVDGVTAPSATVGFAKIFVDTADGDLKVIFGDGVVKTLATDV
jgi:hypothetical protein